MKFIKNDFGKDIWQDIERKLEQRKRQTLRYIEYKRLLRVRKLTVPQYQNCMNCGETLHGMYCFRCGQYALDVNQKFTKYLKQFLENTYQLDGKVLQTIRFLVMKPGFLTNEFQKGRINSYMHPLKLFMFLSVIFFSFVLLLYSDLNIYDRIESRFSSTKNIVLADKQQLQELADSYHENKDASQFWEKEMHFLDKHSLTATDSVGTKESDSKKNQRQVVKMLYRESFAQLTKYTPLILLLLVPCYAGLMKASLKKRLSNYMHNLVFALHVHAFFLLLVIMAALLLYFFNGPFIKAIFIIFLIYHLVAVRNVYHAGWIASVMRTVVNLFIYSIVLSFTLIILTIIMVYRFSLEFDLPSITIK